MARWGLTPIRLFSADLDGTLVGSREAEAHFFEAWMSIDEGARPLLVYNSGRLLDDIRQLLPQTNLPPADVLIGGVGTMLLRFQCLGEGDLYAQSFDKGFDRNLIEELLGSAAPGIKLQPDIYQSRFKSSWYLVNAGEDELSHIEAALSNAGLRVKLVYSSDRDLDILPRGVDKGSALAWLCKRLSITTGEVLVAGDTNNDKSMFDLANVRGIIVANALEELRSLAARNGRLYSAKRDEGWGVVEGLVHFGLLAGQRRLRCAD